MRSTLFMGLLAVAGINADSTYFIERDEMENLGHVPQGWKEIGAPAQDKKLHLRIAVHSPNHDLFEQTLLDISTPSHPRYGQHLKREELKELIKPRAESSDAVLSWIKNSDVPDTDIDNDGEWVNFMVPVSKAETMLNTTFKIYQSQIRSDIKRVRALHYSVPKSVRDHIDMIQPTTRFGQIRPQMNHIHDQHEIPDLRITASVNVTCNTTITPQCIKDLYNFADYIPGKANVTIGVTGYLEQYPKFSDFAKFASLVAPWTVGSNFTYTSVNGGGTDQNATDDSVEASLDIDYTLGLVAPAVGVNFYSTPGRGLLIPDLDQPTQDDNSNEPYLDFFTYALSLQDSELPQVISTSYGEDEQSIPLEYQKKVCDMIGQLGTRGVSVIFSSGDTGVGSACQTNDGKNTTRFLPTFPASCPYVTSVGGTRNIGPEVAVSFSSGGFSDVYERPTYQDTAVTSYFNKLGSKWEGLYNSTGRGIPDISAQGRSFVVLDKGRQISVGGTSASAPVIASIVGLLNNARLSAGKPALGFLNPWLYSQGKSGLNDITGGGSTGCTGRSIYSGLEAPFVPYASWNATEGWDPVTGLGTPDFKKLKDIALGGGGYSGRRGLGGV